MNVKRDMSQQADNSLVGWELAANRPTTKDLTSDFGAGATKAPAASDAPLRLDGIDGESTDDKHKSEIDMFSFGAGEARKAGGEQQEYRSPAPEEEEGTLVDRAEIDAIVETVEVVEAVDIAVTVDAAQTEAGMEYYTDPTASSTVVFPHQVTNVEDEQSVVQFTMSDL